MSRKTCPGPWDILNSARLVEMHGGKVHWLRPKNQSLFRLIEYNIFYNV